MEKIHKKEMDHSYVLFSGGEIKEESYPVRMVLHHLLDGLLPCHVRILDQKKTWICDSTGKCSLLEYCRSKDLDGEELRWIGEGILQNLKELRSYLIDEGFLLLDPAEIYLDVEEKIVRNCFVPFYEADVREGLTGIGQFFLGHLNQKDEDAVGLAYQLFRCLNKGEWTLDELEKILHNKSKMVDIKDEKRDEDDLEQITFSNEVEVGKEPKDDVKASWSVGTLVLCSVPFVIAVLLGIYFFWNEWYLSDFVKITVAILVLLCVMLGVVLHKKWKPNELKKTGLEEISSMDQQEESYEKWKESLIETTKEEEKDLQQTGEIRLDEEVIKEEALAFGKLIQVDTKEEIVLTKNPTVIGKIPEVSQVLLDSLFVSRLHAKVWMEDNTFFVEDLNSKNGTFINAVKIEPQKPVPVKENDELAFANMRYFLQL